MVQLEQDGQKPRQVQAKDAFVSPATCEYNKEIFVSFSAAVGLNKMGRWLMEYHEIRFLIKTDRPFHRINCLRVHECRPVHCPLN